MFIVKAMYFLELLAGYGGFVKSVIIYFQIPREILNDGSESQLKQTMN